ncbi:hypothetical protein AQUCO_00201049v1 [Aquilegia coerulea]|uniref:Uncharacterized protein n=1 Tax=Aquilegia coerulea TaxID=218851 RepID=A0A2G5F5Y3_AQUCA|nr:hypothetical protein AQUCO_00201049v1 [Aquilegia coerulea]
MITRFPFNITEIISFFRKLIPITPPSPPPPPPPLPSTHFIVRMAGMTIVQNLSSQPPTTFSSNSIIQRFDQSSSAYSTIVIVDERLSSWSSLPCTSYHPFDLSLSSSTTSTTSIFTRYYEELRTMSFAVVIGLFGVNYERIDGYEVVTGVVAYWCTT